MKQVYNKLPKFLQKIAFNIYGIIIFIRRYNLTFRNISEQIKNNNLSANLNSYQNTKLDEIYLSAKKLKFWEPIFLELNINNSTDFFEKFNTLPIINNKVVKANLNDMYHINKKHAQIQSSGSTGNPTKIFRDKNFEPIQWAYWWRYRNDLGIKRKEWSAVFSSKMISNSKKDLFRINYITRQIYFNSYMLNDESTSEILQVIKKKRIRWIHGFPSSIIVLAQANLSESILKKNQINWVTTGGENLSLNNKYLIEKAFGCQVREHYGLAEGVVNISECKKGHLHVDEDFSLVEFIPSDLGGYHLIGTSYFNKVMPLIRYDTGDIVTDFRQSNCNFHKGRIVEEIDGRNDDHIILPDGSKLGRLSILFSPFKSISEGQIIQEEIDSIKILISVTEEFDEIIEKNFKNHIDSYLLNRISYEIIYTNNFEKTKGSKHRLVIRKLGDKL